MLLEVRDDTAGGASFLCQTSARLKVSHAMEHVARVSQLRLELRRGLFTPAHITAHRAGVGGSSA